jgi:hypothetical protein
MTVRTFVSTVLALLCFAVVGPSAQQQPQGAEAARTAFAVPTTVRVVRDVVYRCANAPVALKAIEAPNTHAFWDATRYFPETIKRATEFLRAHLNTVR